MENRKQIVVVLGGNNKIRAQKAQRYQVHNHDSSQRVCTLPVILTGFAYEVVEMQQIIQCEAYLHTRAWDTLTNALGIKRIIKENRLSPEKLLIITGKNHFNRFKRIWDLPYFGKRLFPVIQLEHLDSGEKENKNEKILKFLYSLPCGIGIYLVCLVARILRWR